MNRPEGGPGSALPRLPTLADRINWIMETQGASGRSLARAAGLRSETHIGQILKGADPRLSTVRAIARAAGVPVAWLVGD